jgi:hypothetical protein
MVAAARAGAIVIIIIMTTINFGLAGHRIRIGDRRSGFFASLVSMPRAAPPGQDRVPDEGSGAVSRLWRAKTGT